MMNVDRKWIIRTRTWQEDLNTLLYTRETTGYKENEFKETFYSLMSGYVQTFIQHHHLLHSQVLSP
jgi:hypothetical protein